jgi:hypothetical protein
MADGGSLIPISDAQAGAIKKALEVLQSIGEFLRETFGTIPEDVVGLLGGNWLNVRRAENFVRIAAKAQERLRKRGIRVREPVSLSIVLPLVAAAADESRDELQELWARLIAAAADPARAKSFRNAFIDAAKKMDPLDGAVLQTLQKHLDGAVLPETREKLPALLNARRDETDVSISNLQTLGLVNPALPNTSISPFGREFLRAVQD